jgi:hypothetical protein
MQKANAILKVKHELEQCAHILKKKWIIEKKIKNLGSNSSNV